MEVSLITERVQTRFSAIIQKLIDEKVLPAEIVLYMYYQKGNSQKSRSLSFFTGGIPHHIKNEVSKVALERITTKGTAYNDDHVCFSNIVITTHGGTVVNGKLQPLGLDERIAVSKVVGASVLHVGSFIKGSILNRITEDRFSAAVTIAEFEALMN